MAQHRKRRHGDEAKDEAADQLRRWQVAVIALRIVEIVYELFFRDRWPWL